MTRRSWTTKTLAHAIGAPVSLVAQILNSEVNEGRVVRLTAGGVSYYLDGPLPHVLGNLGALPADGTDVDRLKAQLRAQPGTRQHRVDAARERAQRVLRGGAQ